MKWTEASVLALALGAVLVGRRALAPAGRVLERARAAGVAPELVALLDAWDVSGPHAVLVAPYGGLRTTQEDQSKLAELGMSAATNLATTPHGRGAALDVWPVAFLAHVPRSWGGTASRWSTWDEVDEPIKAQFATFGAFAEARGLQWGGRWRSSKYPSGDQPHVELPNWQRLPFPPPPQVQA